MSVLLPPRPLEPGIPRVGTWFWLVDPLAAVAVAELVTAWTGRDARIKWPNDVRIDRRKIAGILVERIVGPRRSGKNKDPDAYSPARGVPSSEGLERRLNNRSNRPRNQERIGSSRSSRSLGCLRALRSCCSRR